MIAGKARIVILPDEYKDIEMLQAGKGAEFSRAFWAAQTYTPSGVINLSNKISVSVQENKSSVPYPWQGLNKSFGLRQGELVTFTGGTGLGSLL